MNNRIFNIASIVVSMFVTVNCASHIGHDAMNNAAVPKWERDPYRWYIFRDSVDREIRHQIAGETPTGGSTDWNEHWQWRIKTAQHFADPEKHVNYIIQRRKRNLHPLLFYSKAHWPFQHNRTPATVLVTTLLLILWVIRSARGGFGVRPSPAAATFVQRWVLAGFRTFGVSSLSAPGDGRTPTAARAAQKFTTRNSAFEIDLTARERRRFTHPLWQQSLSVFMMVALIFTTTPTEVHAQVYSPVFYYYIADHLGSSSVMTDRAGVLVQHYEYAAYGNERYNAGTPALQVSNRYTGQVLDEETGLYYYNARYYDPELGRFTQPDTMVPDPSHSQTLNRYTYVDNNPLKYTDPSGHELVTAVVIAIAVVVGAAVGGATAAATGGNVGLGILVGAVGGLFGGVGAWAGGVLGPMVSSAASAATVGGFVGAVAGGAAGGAVGAAITGGDVGMGALTGAISGAIGFGLGKFNANILKNAIPDFLVATAGGALGGGIGAELQGGDFGEGAMYGAAAGAAGFVVSDIVHGVFAKADSRASVPKTCHDIDRVVVDNTKPISNPIANALTKIWAFPMTALGLAYGLLNYPIGARITIGHNAIEFNNVLGGDGAALTLGNSILYARTSAPIPTRLQFGAYGDNYVQTGPHEEGHTWQYQRLGPLFPVAYFLSGGISSRNPFEQAANLYARKSP